MHLGTIRVDRTLLTILTSNGALLKPFGKHCTPDWTCLSRRFCRCCAGPYVGALGSISHWHASSLPLLEHYCSRPSRYGLFSPLVAKIWSYALFAIRPCRFQLWRAYCFYISVMSLEHNIHSVLTPKNRRLRTVVKISSSLSINFAFAFGASQYERNVVFLGLIRTLNDAQSSMRARLTLFPHMDSGCSSSERSYSNPLNPIPDK